MKRESWIPIFIITLFLAWLFWKIWYQVGINVNYENGYTLGDWLINYEDGGFKRRGLSGSFFIFINDYLGVSLKKSVRAFQLVCYAAFFVSYLRLVYRSSVFFLYLSLFFSVGTFLYMVLELGSIGRKEIILFAAYTLYLNLLDCLPKNYKLVFVYLLVTSFIGILFHEIYFFYLPFFVLPLVYKPKFQLSKNQLVALFAGVGGLSLLLVIALKVFGVEINEGETFAILEVRGISDKMATYGNMGILTWNDNFDKLAYFKNNNYSLYLISWLIGSVIFYVYCKIENLFEGKYDFLLITLCTFLLSLPAYVLAIDWGRWLHIQFMMTLLYLTYYQRGRAGAKMDLKVVLYLLLVLISCLLWRFDLVDKGFYIQSY